MKLTLKLTEHESQCQKSVMIINIIQMIYLGHVLEAPGLYQQTLLWKLE